MINSLAMGRIKIYLERGCDPEATAILGGVKAEGILMVQVTMYVLWCRAS
jgi:hypothetical protein